MIDQHTHTVIEVVEHRETMNCTVNQHVDLMIEHRAQRREIKVKPMLTMRARKMMSRFLLVSVNLNMSCRVLQCCWAHVRHRLTNVRSGVNHQNLTIPDMMRRTQDARRRNTVVPISVLCKENGAMVR